MPQLAVRGVRLIEPEVAVVSCLAFEHELELLAAARCVRRDDWEEWFLELWQYVQGPHIYLDLERRAADVASVDALLWVDRRLLSAGRDGCVVEFDARRLLQVAKLQVCPSPIWCMAKAPDGDSLAVGADDGSLFSVDVSAGLLQFQRVICSGAGERVISLAWHPSGRQLLAGGVDAIVQVDASSGRRLHRIAVGRTAETLSTVVWAVEFVSDSAAVSGDSRGKVSFWNTKNGTLICSHQMHQADVLALCVPTEGEVMAAGVDPRMQVFGRVARTDWRAAADRSQPLRATSGGGGGTAGADLSDWRPSATRHLHSHDVRAVERGADSTVYSAGVDTYICLSSHNSQQRYPPFSHRAFQLAPHARLLLCRYTKRIEIWKIPSSVGEQFDAERPEKLVEMRCAKRKCILTATIDKSGQYVHYSTLTESRLYKIEESSVVVGEAELSLRAVKPLNTDNLPAVEASAFTTDRANLCLIAATLTGEILRVSIDDMVCQVERLAAFRDDEGSVRQLQVSADGAFAAALLSDGGVRVLRTADAAWLSMDDDEPWRVVDMGFVGGGAALQLLGADGRLREYACDTAAWLDGRVDTAAAFDRHAAPPHALGVGVAASVVYSASRLLRVERPRSHDRLTRGGATDRFDHLCFVGWLDENKDEALVLPIDPASYAAQLPPAVKLKKFATA